MVKIKSKTRVVCDAGPIIHLDEIGCLNLMKDFEKILVPEGVRKEVLRHRAVAFENTDVKWTVVSHQLPINQSPSLAKNNKVRKEVIAYFFIRAPQNKEVVHIFMDVDKRHFLY